MNSFPRARLEENCDLRGTDIFKDKYANISSKSSGGYWVYYPSNVFRDTRDLPICHIPITSKENLGVSLGNMIRIFPTFSWVLFSHVTRLDQSRASENMWWIIIPNLKRKTTNKLQAVHVRTKSENVWQKKFVVFSCWKRTSKKLGMQSLLHTYIDGCTLSLDLIWRGYNC